MTSQAVVSLQESVKVIKNVCPGVSFATPRFENVHVRIIFQGKTHTLDVRMATSDTQQKLENSILCLVSRLMYCSRCMHESCNSEYTHLLSSLERAVGHNRVHRLLEALEEKKRDHSEWFPEDFHLQVHDPHF